MPISQSHNITTPADIPFSPIFSPTDSIKTILVTELTFLDSGYIIYERATSSLISIDPGDIEVATKNIQLLELEFNARLRYVLSTHHHEGHNAAASKLKSKFKDIDVVIGKGNFPYEILRQLWKQKKLPYQSSGRNKAL